MSSIKQNSSKSKKARAILSQHVVPQNGRWVVRKTGSKRATSIHSTQAEAVKAASRIARNQRSEVIIHSRNGRIRQRASYSPADELMLRVWKKTHEDYSKSKRK
jgi:hypothetical protein